MDELKNRKSPRCNDFDYNTEGVYFITICTRNHRCVLSRIVGTGVPDCPKRTEIEDVERPQIELTRSGEIADKYIKQLSEFYDYLSVEHYVIMPNHIHLMLWVKKNVKDGQSRTPVPTIVERANASCSRFVATFKRFCNKEYGENIWQARFFDHYIRNHNDYEEHVEYIYNNPNKWYFDKLYSEE